jgi:hypothetical protein
MVKVQGIAYRIAGGPAFIQSGIYRRADILGITPTIIEGIPLAAVDIPVPLMSGTGRSIEIYRRKKQILSITADPGITIRIVAAHF